MSVVYSECEEEEEGEADEGIYIPGKKSTNIGVANQRTPVEVNKLIFNYLSRF